MNTHCGGYAGGAATTCGGTNEISRPRRAIAKRVLERRESKTIGGFVGAASCGHGGDEIRALRTNQTRIVRCLVSGTHGVEVATETCAGTNGANRPRRRTAGILALLDALAIGGP